VFHVDNFLYFGRLDNGDVRMLKFKHRPSLQPDVNRIYISADVEFDVTLPSSAWASVVASVSKHGECDGRFYVAQAFHMNPRPTPAPRAPADVFGANF
jgi:hypothetical protein